MLQNFDSSRVSLKGMIWYRDYVQPILTQKLNPQPLRPKLQRRGDYITLSWHRHRLWITPCQLTSFAPDAQDGRALDLIVLTSQGRSTRLASGSSCDSKSEKFWEYPWRTLTCCRSRCGWNLSRLSQRISRVIWPHHKSRNRRDRTNQVGNQIWGCRCRTSSWTKNSQFDCFFHGWYPYWSHLIHL